MKKKHSPVFSMHKELTLVNLIILHKAEMSGHGTRTPNIKRRIALVFVVNHRFSPSFKIASKILKEGNLGRHPILNYDLRRKSPPDLCRKSEKNRHSAYREWVLLVCR